MKKILLFEMKSLYRDNMRVYGYLFGADVLFPGESVPVSAAGGDGLFPAEQAGTDGASRCEKTIAIVGGMRGNEFTQIYEASQLVKHLTHLEEQGRIAEGKTILVIPTVNPYSVNSEKRFWPTDNTDINRMFPGYDKGETTQRVTAALFKILDGFRYGIHLTSHYISGNFIPHVKILDTGRDYTESAKAFGLAYIHSASPSFYDTTTLNYNWQVWETEAYSIYGGDDKNTDPDAASQVINAILNFMDHNSIVQFGHHRGYISSVITDADQKVIKSAHAGFFDCHVRIGDVVHQGQKIASILDMGDGSVLEEITSPCEGIVFFIQSNPLAFAGGQLMLLV